MSQRFVMMSLLLGLLCAGCTLNSGTPESALTLPEGAQICPEQRPEVCTMEYMPVCGVYPDQRAKTFSSGCRACADAEVVYWLSDACEAKE